MLDQIEHHLANIGLFCRGGFHPGPEDAVPDLPTGARTETVVLVGNAGAAMWEAFVSGADPAEGRNPLDRWLKPRIANAAQAVGAHPIFPNEGPPFVPIQDWAVRAEPVYRSPLGIMIHPEFGLWHVYRAAFCFADRLDLPPRGDRSSPCDTCATKPCLKVCPVDAFKPDRFAATDCADHVLGDSGTVCRERGCMARRACPVGQDLQYPRPAQEFHTAAFTRAVLARYGGS